MWSMRHVAQSSYYTSSPSPDYWIRRAEAEGDWGLGGYDSSDDSSDDIDPTENVAYLSGGARLCGICGEVFCHEWLVCHRCFCPWCCERYPRGSSYCRGCEDCSECGEALPWVYHKTMEGWLVCGVDCALRSLRRRGLGDLEMTCDACGVRILTAVELKHSSFSHFFCQKCILSFDYLSLFAYTYCVAFDKKPWSRF